LQNGSVAFQNMIYIFAIENPDDPNNASFHSSQPKYSLPLIIIDGPPVGIVGKSSLTLIGALIDAT
jgi:hypothetical protein